MRPVSAAKRSVHDPCLKPRFATYRPGPDGRQSCGGQPPTRSNAGEEAPAAHQVLRRALERPPEKLSDAAVVAGDGAATEAVEAAR